MPEIIVTRDRALAGAAVPYRVVINSQRAGRVWFGGSVTIEATAGSHLLQVYSGSTVCCSGRVEAGHAYVLTHPRLTPRSFLRGLICGLRPRLVEGTG